MSEERYECVFGYGDCPIRGLIAKERREAEMFARSVPQVKFGEELSRETRESINAWFQTTMRWASKIALSDRACPSGLTSAYGGRDHE